VSADFTVLILGGYGTFGGRLAQLLADDPRLTLMIAGRSRDKAAAFCAQLPAGATKVPLAFDREGDVGAQLRSAKPDVVVDATGPFQHYGDEPYRVVQAALAAGSNYLDLADGSGFVNGIVRFDSEARRNNLFILSGVSSFPVLTAAAVRLLAKDMARVDAIAGGIAPSPYAGVGLNVIRAIAGYAGRPVSIRQDSRDVVAHALTDARRYTISPPGRLPLKPTRFSLVDVPDLQVLPQLWPDVRSVWMGAGPVPEVLHRSLNLLAYLVRLKLLPSLLPFASLMHGVINRVRWGEHRGGMFVSVEGVTKNGAAVERSWHLLAEGDDGPLIPSMAAAAIISGLADGRRPAPGARSAATDLEVSDYGPLFEQRTICTGIRERSPPAAALYRQLLGEAWQSLPAPIAAMHDLAADLTADGVATVERGRGLLARLIGFLFGFPAPGQAVPVAVSFHVEEGREIWRRTFAGRSFSSVQFGGRGRFDRLLCETFGPLTFGLALVVEGDRLRLVLRRWSFLGVPLPLALAPRGEAFESAADGRFNFDVEIGHPLTGLIVRYRGWLHPNSAVKGVDAAGGALAKQREQTSSTPQHIRI
jgi:hypothetical protein